MYGEDGQPWLSLVLSDSSGPVVMWAKLTTSWQNIGVLVSAKLHFWYHVCVLVDTRLGRMEVALNGEVLWNSTDISSYTKTRPRSLKNKLVIGKYVAGAVDAQFYWSVTNVNVFSGATVKDSKDLATLSAEVCSLDGDYLSWSDMVWTRTGDRVAVEEVAQDTVCGRTGRYRLAVPVQMAHGQAVATCHKLDGRMAVAEDLKQLEDDMSWFDTQTGGDCNLVWTPITDERTEGRFVDTEDGSSPTFLPWTSGQPNGGREENVVAVDRAKMPRPYKDTTALNTHCFSCSLPQTEGLRLKGLCAGSLLGRLNIPLKM